MNAALDRPRRAPARACPNFARFFAAFRTLPVVDSGAGYCEEVIAVTPFWAPRRLTRRPWLRRRGGLRVPAAQMPDARNLVVVRARPQLARGPSPPPREGSPWQSRRAPARTRDFLPKGLRRGRRFFRRDAGKTLRRHCASAPGLRRLRGPRFPTSFLEAAWRVPRRRARTPCGEQNRDSERREAS